ncbi:MAG: helix-turn-helix transcriptional regulator [Sphingobacteriales bacterium]
MLDLDGLAEKGIKFSDTTIWRLIRAGDFPKPVKIGNRNHWVETEIDQYIAHKLAQREEESAHKTIAACHMRQNLSPDAALLAKINTAVAVANEAEANHVAHWGHQAKVYPSGENY